MEIPLQIVTRSIPHKVSHELPTRKTSSPNFHLWSDA